MKKYVIGWTHFDNEKIEEADCGYSDNAAIIDDIRAHGYSFSGYAHQELDGGAPVMNDGRVRRFSRRIWGNTMAHAHDSLGPYDYTLWAEAFETKEAELRGMPSADRWIKKAPPTIPPTYWVFWVVMEPLKVQPVILTALPLPSMPPTIPPR